MAIQTLNTIKEWFKTGLKPSQNQFWDTWDSFRHKLEQIPLKDIEELETALGTKAEKFQLDEHKNDQNAHTELFSVKENKSEKGIAGGYVPLNDLAKITSQYLTIINDLTTGGTESLLSAEQGVILQNQINGINTLLSSSSDFINHSTAARTPSADDLNKIYPNAPIGSNVYFTKINGTPAGQMYNFRKSPLGWINAGLVQFLN